MKRTRNQDNVFESTDIINIVNDISSTIATVTEKKTIFSQKYPEFAEQFPVLFASACEPEFDHKRFMYMMRMRDEVAAEKRTFEAASKKIGQDLFDEYVKPIIDKK